MKYDKKRTVCAAVAAVLLAALTAFAFLTPSVAADPLYGDMPPALFGGQRHLLLNAESLAYYRGMTVTREDGTACAAVVSAREESGTGNTAYAVTLDARYAVGFIYRDITPAAYEQAEKLGLLHPLLDSGTAAAPTAAVDANAPGCGYLLDETGEPLLYVPSAHGALRRVRVFYADWYAYQNGRAPIFLLGTDSAGNDVASGIAAALKTGLAAALCVAVAAFAAGGSTARCLGASDARWDGCWTWPPASAQSSLRHCAPVICPRASARKRRCFVRWRGSAGCGRRCVAAARRGKSGAWRLPAPCRRRRWLCCWGRRSPAAAGLRHPISVRCLRAAWEARLTRCGYPPCFWRC